MASTTAATPQASSSSPSTTLLLPQTYEARPAGKLQSRTRHSIDLADLTPNNVGQLRKLNSVLFPVKYSQGFYNEALLEERKRVNKLGTSQRAREVRQRYSLREIALARRLTLIPRPPAQPSSMTCP